jgi:curved DNA-binding protein CbpA
MDANALDYYTLLGIDRSASDDEIGHAYRRAARATHPDIHPDEPAAGEHFNAIAIAYETLSDPARRASYDRARPLTPLLNRVEPLNPRHAKTNVTPIRHERPPKAPTPLHLATRPARPAREDDVSELVASLSRLLHSRWF